jgi:Histidine kinase-, DNA gyrase B-, and HSP90-like ATPase
MQDGRQRQRSGGCRMSDILIATMPVCPAQKRTAQFQRTTFSTSRLLDFCSEKELTAQTGHDSDDWPLVIVKELADNALDACEEAGIAPVVEIRVHEAGISVFDNGPGLPAETIKAVLDFAVRVSSREAYVSPTRGAQGNALKTILAMPFVLSGGKHGLVEIKTQGERHRIDFAVDQLRQQPVIGHAVEPAERKNGTEVKVRWPDLACSVLADAKDPEPALVPDHRLVRRDPDRWRHRHGLDQVEALGSYFASLVHAGSVRAAGRRLCST